MAPESAAQDPAGDEFETYLGLDAGEAERRAGEEGWTTVRRLAPDAIITMEYLEGRLNLAVEDGSVVRCWRG